MNVMQAFHTIEGLKKTEGLERQSSSHQKLWPTFSAQIKPCDTS